MTKAVAEPRLIAENRKARFDYFIEERYEAGLALQGWEVKSMRAGRAQLKEAYVYLRDGEAFLIGAHLSPLPSASTHVTPDPVRTRKLLLHQSELQRPHRRGRATRLHARAAGAVLEERPRQARPRPRQGQEAARQARRGEGARLGARQGTSPAPRLSAYSGASFGFFSSYTRLSVLSVSVDTEPAGG